MTFLLEVVMFKLNIAEVLFENITAIIMRKHFVRSCLNNGYIIDEDFNRFEGGGWHNKDDVVSAPVREISLNVLRRKRWQRKRKTLVCS